MSSTRPTHRRSIAAAAAFLALAALPARGVSLQLAWSREYGPESNIWYAHRAAALAGEYVVVGGQRENRGTSNTEAWLLEVDPSGQVVGGPSTAPDFRTLRALSSDAAYAVAVHGDGRPSLLRRGAGRDVSVVADLVSGAESPTIVRLARLGPELLVAVGSDEQGAVAIGVGADGKVRWQKRPEGVRLEAFVDAAPDGAGGFVLIGNARLAAPAPADFGSEGRPAASKEPPIVWVGKYGADGARTAERSFPGRHGSIARVRDGYALAYDRGQGESQDIVLQRLSDGLGDVWSAPVFRAVAGYQYFRLAPLASGGFVVVGGKDDQPYVVLLSASGQRLADFVGTNLLRSESYEVVTSGDAIFVVSTVFVEFDVDGKRDAAQKVRVLRLEPKAT